MSNKNTMLHDDRIITIKQTAERDFTVEREIAKTLEHIKSAYISKVPDKEFWNIAIGLAFAILKCAYYGGRKPRKLLNDLISLIRYFEDSLIPRPPIAAYQITKIVEMIDETSELARDEEFSLHEFVELCLRILNQEFPELIPSRINLKVLTEEILDYLNSTDNLPKVVELLRHCKHYVYKK